MSSDEKERLEAMLAAHVEWRRVLQLVARGVPEGHALTGLEAVLLTLITNGPNDP